MHRNFKREEKHDLWENIARADSETLLKALQLAEEGCLLVSSLMDSMKGIKPLTDSQIKEIESLGIKAEGVFQEIEPETREIGRKYGEFYIERYENEGKKLKKNDPEKFNYLVQIGRYNPDGSLPENRRQHQFRMGITQKAFEIALQQLQIPYIHNDPTIDWRAKFLYDFSIPSVEKIDIKSATLDNPNVNINCREFESEKPDIVVAYQILNPKWLKLVGFMYNSEIKQYETLGRGYRKYWRIPIEDFERKHNAESLLDILSKAKHKIEKISEPLEPDKAISREK